VADVVFILMTLAFFALCIAYVRGLDRMVRASEEPDSGGESTR
jgi:hypothetical protein